LKRKAQSPRNNRYGQDFWVHRRSVFQESYLGDQRENRPGAWFYETNRDVKWICKALQRMEARGEDFEGRLRALEV